MRQGPLDKVAAFARSAESGIVQRIRRSRFHGWRMGVLFGCCMSTIVLLCNVAIIITGSVKGYDKDGTADLIVGDVTSISQ